MATPKKKAVQKPQSAPSRGTAANAKAMAALMQGKTSPGGKK